MAPGTGQGVERAGYHQLEWSTGGKDWAVGPLLGSGGGFNRRRIAVGRLARLDVRVRVVPRV